LSAAYAARGGELESLLLREDDAGRGQRLTGVTRLGDGTRLWEEARFDAAGKLTRAEFMCACPSGSSERVVFDASSGMVEVRSTQGARRWSVPTDHRSGADHFSGDCSVARPWLVRPAAESGEALVTWF
jgi:hypothetical protein